MMKSHAALAGQVALVTGGARGYGLGIAKALQAAGATVWITGRDEAALLQAGTSLGVRWVRADVTSSRDWDTAIEKVTSVNGRLDLLVNNAGAAVRVAPLAEQTDDEIRQIVNTNLVGALLGSRRAATLMTRQKSGMIINISSGCALHAWPGWTAYSAAKAGLNQASHGLYTELRPHGVRVTTITPYWGATDFVAASGIHGHPAGDPEIRKHVMQPSEMGDMVVHLASMPAHLEVPDITVQPMIQQIEPM